MWKVKYTKKFLKELASYPQDIQARVESIVFSETAELVGWVARQQNPT